MVFGGVKLVETDYGTKGKARQAIDKILKTKPKVFRKLMRQYVNAVLNDAKNFCPVDTGALRFSIRLLVREAVPKGRFVVGRDITEQYMITAGGPPYINPKTKRVVDYAQAVHDGTLKMPPNPFLSDALAKNKLLLDHITDRYLKYIEEEWGD